MQNALKKHLRFIMLIKVREQPLVCALLMGMGIVVFLGTAGAWYVFRLSQNLPTLSQLQNIQQPLASKVLDKDGRIVHEFGIERRSFVPLDKIPISLQNAVVAIEDRKFYRHWGIDIRRLLQAAVIDVVRHGYEQGASTLTQQLARNLYLTAKPSMERKIREALTAIQLESCYTKKEILELYLNVVEWGDGIFGIEAASQCYFGHSAAQLSAHEAAQLAAALPNPIKFRPTSPARYVTRRSRLIYAIMVRQGVIV